MMTAVTGGWPVTVMNIKTKPFSWTRLIIRVFSKLKCLHLFLESLLLSASYSHQLSAVWCRAGSVQMALKFSVKCKIKCACIHFFLSCGCLCVASEMLAVETCAFLLNEMDADATCPVVLGKIGSGVPVAPKQKFLILVLKHLVS